VSRSLPAQSILSKRAYFDNHSAPPCKGEHAGDWLPVCTSQAPRLWMRRRRRAVAKLPLVKGALPRFFRERPILSVFWYHSDRAQQSAERTTFACCRQASVNRTKTSHSRLFPRRDLALHRSLEFSCPEVCPGSSRCALPELLVGAVLLNASEGRYNCKRAHRRMGSFLFC
jgi:hypothetical protein